MLIIPAIDLLGGKVVRLYKGDKNNCKVYNNDPLAVAQEWKDKGASLLHVVDLDAAFGDGNNLDKIKGIVELGIEVQVGGGLRSFKKITEVMKIGVKRIIIGTKAKEPIFLKTAREFCSPDVIGVSVDILDGKLMDSGWLNRTDYDFFDYIDYLKDNRIKWIVYTNISRDGTLSGIDLEEIKKVSRVVNINCIVSGGISSLADISNIKREFPSAWGVIVGKALYEGYIDLEAANRLFA
ncbi:MAG: 1-(5-phosphoribosyl)-5-[(5-phosphoribosylamino)methylideneamino] imidazole-4-carboxamide isomerase [Candidatus Omnitrophota bacterium]